MAAATRPRPPIRALLIDLSGTLHVGSTPTPGAVESLARLRHNSRGSDHGACIPFRFCSNTSKEGRRELEQRLRGMGFDLGSSSHVQDEKGKGREMWTSLGAVSALLQRQGLKKPLCLLEPSAKDEILHDLQAASGGSGKCTCVCSVKSLKA